MSLIRLLPAWLHAIADYAVGGLLVVAALIVGGSAAAVATGVVVGAVVLIVSMLTKYPLGVVKVLPFTLHSAGDYLAAVLLFIGPFALGFNNSDSGLTALYLASGAAVLGVSLITNYQYRGTPASETMPIPAEVAAPSAPRTAKTVDLTDPKPTARRERPLRAAGRR
jgi:hypothetical protein